MKLFFLISIIRSYVIVRDRTWLKFEQVQRSAKYSPNSDKSDKSDFCQIRINSIRPKP
jgi:hypothetical protein